MIKVINVKSGWICYIFPLKDKNSYKQAILHFYGSLKSNWVDHVDYRQAILLQCSPREVGVKV